MHWIAGLAALLYLAALALEVSRLFFRLRVRMVLILACCLAGLVVQSVHLWMWTADAVTSRTLLLSTWSFWCLAAAWVAAGAICFSSVRSPQSVLGLFLLPLILGLLAAAAAVDGLAPVSRATGEVLAGLVHGASLLLGCASVTLGLVAGLLYLWQSWRLKHKLPAGRGFRLPSLEMLQRWNERTLHVSSMLLAVGVLSGVALNWMNHATPGGGFPWSDPLVITSLAMLVWIAAATLFEVLYRPARQGQKIAYLTLANFVFLGLVMGMLLIGWTAHSGGAA